MPLSFPRVRYLFRGCFGVSESAFHEYRWPIKMLRRHFYGLHLIIDLGHFPNGDTTPTASFIPAQGTRPVGYAHSRAFRRRVRYPTGRAP
jgi:hypothetical protein